MKVDNNEATAKEMVVLRETCQGDNNKVVTRETIVSRGTLETLGFLYHV